MGKVNINMKIFIIMLQGIKETHLEKLPISTEEKQVLDEVVKLFLFRGCKNINLCELRIVIFVFQSKTLLLQLGSELYTLSIICLYMLYSSSCKHI